jgi:predicted MPP superfamily phosphohydrolase
VRRLDVPIAGLPVGLDGLRIAQVTDFHFRRWNRVFQAAQQLLLSVEYDLLVATGDFADAVDRWPQAAELTRAFFEPLIGRAPMYAVLGNHDHPALAAADTPLTFLRNRSVRIDFGGAALELAGVDQHVGNGEDLHAALQSVHRPESTILLAHYPSTVLRLTPRRVSLVLSGHTHGGQIRFPFLGCVWANDRIPLPMARGLHQIAGTWLHTSPGIGVSRPVRIRISCPPEVSVLTLHPVGAESAGIPDRAVPSLERVSPH